ncbi:MAG: hypothetical protein ACRDBY_12735 [Cetobacterium sp.]
MSRKGFLSKCKKKEVSEGLFFIYSGNNNYMATVNENNKTIKLDKNNYEYHSSLIRDL